MWPARRNAVKEEKVLDFKTFAVFCILYAFFWVRPRHLNSMCRHFRTLFLFHLYRRIGMKNDWGWGCWSIYMGKGFAQKIAWAKRRLRLFSSQTFLRKNTPAFSNPIILHAYPPMKMEQSVLKCRHIEFRRRGNYPEESIQHSKHGESFELKNELVHCVLQGQW